MNDQRLQQRLEGEMVELKGAIADVQRLLDKFQQTQDSDLLPAIAMDLQSFYTGVERMMVAVAMSCEQRVPEGDRWHRLLLEQMGRAVPDIRPPFISSEGKEHLDELRRFRHVVRGIYAFKLDPDLLLPIAQGMTHWFDAFTQDCDDFWALLTAQTED